MACKMASEESLDMIEANLMLQKAAVDAPDLALLHELDYEFHRLICMAANCLPAFKTIAENKAHTDRICMLELSDVARMNQTLEDHSNILSALRTGDEARAVEMTRLHLSRLDSTLTRVRDNHTDYFED